MGSHRINYRNENIKLRLLLESTCRTLDEYFPESDVMPARVREWWGIRKRARVQERVEASEAGVADAAVEQILTMEDELVDRCC